MNYTVIVPFYNEEKNISSFNNELINNLKKIDNEKRNFEIIYVDDGSRDETFNELKKLGKKIVKEDKADSILFGCMTMSFAGLEKKLEKEIGIPVLNAGRVALKTLESLISMKISHSETAYPYPEKLKNIKKNKIKISK